MEHQRESNQQVVLRVSPERLVATVLVSGFAGLVLLLMGLAGRMWLMCGAGILVLLVGLFWSAYQRRCEIVFSTDRVFVKTPFSQEMYCYDGLNFLLRRSWTVTYRRGASGLAGTAIQLRKENRPVVTVSASLWSGKQLRAAIAFLEGLPNPKRYL